MAELFVLPCTGVRVTIPTDVPAPVVRRVVGNHGVVASESHVVVAHDLEAAHWIVTTLEILGFSSAITHGREAP